MSDGNNILLRPEQAGDEALLHARRLPGAIVVIGRDRQLAVAQAAKLGATVALLDDGFQFWSLARRLDIVLLDARFPFGNGHLLPTGRLREEPAALSRADAIVFTRANVATPSQLVATRVAVASHSPAPIWEAEHQPFELWDERNEVPVPLTALHGTKLWLISALADNHGFRKSVEGLGAQVRGHLERRDHHHWSRADIPTKWSGPWVTSEKDAVKLDPNWFPGSLWSLRIQLRVRQNEEGLKELIRQRMMSS